MFPKEGEKVDWQTKPLFPVQKQQNVGAFLVPLIIQLSICQSEE